MRKITLFGIVLLFHLHALFAQTPKIIAYDYWFNDQYGAVTTQTVTPSLNYELNTALNVASLGTGLHRFNMRFRDETQRFTQVSSSWFYNLNNPEISGYEYWYNDNSAARTTVNLANTAFLDLSSAFSGPQLTVGLNTFHIRFRNAAGIFSITSSYIFYYNPAPGLMAYEYWFDNNDAAKVTVTYDNTQLIDLTESITTAALSQGMHVVNFRYKNGSGQWSSVVSDFFYKHGGAGNQNSITSYDYWFDDDFASKINVLTVNESTAEILVPVNAASLSTGLHKVHFRFNSGNLKSIVTSDYFYKIGSAGLTENMVTGYRFWFDGNPATMREISLSPPVAGLVMLNDIELPYLPLGKHLLSVDFKDSPGHYSSLVSDSIDVTNCLPYSAGAISGLSAVCKGTNGVVYSIPAISNATGYAWSVPEGVTIVSGSATRSIVVNITEDAQSGIISVSGVNPCGSGNSNAIAVTVTPTPTPSITGDTVVCSGSSAVVYATEPGYANYAWNVTPGGHVVAGWGTNSITVNWITQGGNQKVTVRYSNLTNCQGVKTVDVSVLPLPPSNQTMAGSVVPGGGTLCEDATNTLSVPEPGSSFEVESGGSAILMAGVSVKLMPGVKVYAGGYLHAYLTSDCFYCNAVPHNLPQVPAKSLITEEADEPTVESRGDLQFSVFPNPTTGIFTLELKGADQSSLKRVAIYNLHGSKIREGVIAPELSVSTWNLEGAPSGLYIIKVFTDQGSGTARVMKNE